MNYVGVDSAQNTAVCFVLWTSRAGTSNLAIQFAFLRSGELAALFAFKARINQGTESRRMLTSVL